MGYNYKKIRKVINIMFIIKLPTTTSFNGGIYSVPASLPFSNRAFTEFSYDYSSSSTRVSIESGLSMFVDALGFNPFSFVSTLNTTNYADNETIGDVEAGVRNMCTRLGFNYTPFEKQTGTPFGTPFSNTMLDDNNIAITGCGVFYSRTQPGYSRINGTDLSGMINVDVMEIGSGINKDYYISFTIWFFPENAYDHGKFDHRYVTGHMTSVGGLITTMNVGGSGPVPGTGIDVVKTISLSVTRNTTLAGYDTLFEQIENIDPEFFEVENPYDPYSHHTGGSSITGGGDGAGTAAGVDEIDKAEIPPLPTLSAVSTGFITVYNPTSSQLSSLSSYLWSNAFDIDTFKKLYTDPMECIIGLGIIPVQPTLGGSKSVKFGSVDTGISMPYLGSQWVEVSCGAVDIKKYIGSFMDYAPYVKCSLYLPYIGFHELSADDVMGDSISVTYHVDCLTGGLTAYVYVGGKGIMYQYSGSCIANVPVSAANWSGAIQNAVSAAISGGMTLVGAATGAAPLTMAGMSGLATSAANTALNSKPEIQRSGAMGGSSGLMGYQKPYIVIQRPRPSIPSDLASMTGYNLNMTMNLGKVKGYTMVDTVHLEGISCTEKEKSELESILKKGVIF